MSSTTSPARSAAASLRTRVTSSARDRVQLTVVPLTRSSAPRVPFIMLLSLIVLGGVVGLLLFNTSMQQASFAATALEQQARSLSARQQTLTMELDVLRDPQRVAEQAQSLGMVPVLRPAFLRLSDGAIVGEPSAATSADGIRIRPLPRARPLGLTPMIKVRTVVAEPEKAKKNKKAKNKNKRASKQKSRDTSRASAQEGASAGRNSR